MDMGGGTTTGVYNSKGASLQLHYTSTSRFLQEYDFDVVHRAGEENTNADCLSRYPLKSTAAAPILDLIYLQQHTSPLWRTFETIQEL